MSQSSRPTTRSQSRAGAELVPPVDNPDRIESPLSRLQTTVLEMIGNTTEALNPTQRTSIPGGFHPDESNEEDQTITVGEGIAVNQTAATEADIIEGQAIPRITMTQASSSGSRPSEDGAVSQASIQRRGTPHTGIPPIGPLPITGGEPLDNDLIYWNNR